MRTLIWGGFLVICLVPSGPVWSHGDHPPVEGIHEHAAEHFDLARKERQKKTGGAETLTVEKTPAALGV